MAVTGLNSEAVTLTYPKIYNSYCFLHFYYNLYILGNCLCDSSNCAIAPILLEGDVVICQ